MSAWRRYFGLDGFDTTVHLVISGVIFAIIASESRDPAPALLFAGASLVIFSVRRHFALKTMEARGELSGETRSIRHRDDVEGRLDELETLYGRVAELEERLDFNERLIARQHEAARLEAPKA